MAGEPLDVRCVAFDSVAAEFALGLLAGDQRARAIEHLTRCPRCRGLTDELAVTGDSLLAAVPGQEPSPGFEERVLARFDGVGMAAAGARRVAPEPPAPRTRSRRGALGWLAVAAVSIVLAGVLVVGGGSRPAFAEASMVTASGHKVGDVYVHHGHDPWIFVQLPGWAPQSGDHEHDYRMRLIDGSGHVTEYGEVDLDAGDGVWGAALTADRSDVRTVQMVDGDGVVWCSATVSA